MKNRYSLGWSDSELERNVQNSARNEMIGRTGAAGVTNSFEKTWQFEIFRIYLQVNLLGSLNALFIIKIMWTYILTLFAPLFGGGIALYGSRVANNSFFSKDYTTVLKGLCCLIVVYVHVHEGYGNTLQDAIGSFAYGCVTIFFLISAYGMMLSVERKPNYLKHFFRNRLLALLVPAFLINIINLTSILAIKNKFVLSALYHINGYVAVLLTFCVWFYVVEKCRLYLFKENRFLADALLIGGVIVSSIIGYFFTSDSIKIGAFTGWPYERIGLVWGILLYRYFDKVKEWMEKSRVTKIIVLTILGGILGVTYLKYKWVYFIGAYLLKIVLGFVLILLLFTLTSNRTFGNKASLWLGNISYEVYLLHGFVMGILENVLSKNVNSGFFILLTVFITVILSKMVQCISNPIVYTLRAK